MSTFDTSAWFRSLTAHLDHHPHLTGTVLRATVGRITDGIEVHTDAAGPDDSDLAAFAAWLRSLATVTTVRVGATRERAFHTHLTAHGSLADGVPVAVLVLLDDDESDLLAANARVREGDTLPVELLLRLVDHEAAEQLPASATPAAEQPAEVPAMVTCRVPEACTHPVCNCAIVGGQLTEAVAR